MHTFTNNDVLYGYDNSFILYDHCTVDQFVEQLLISIIVSSQLDNILIVLPNHHPSTLLSSHASFLRLCLNSQFRIAFLFLSFFLSRVLNAG